MVWTCVKCIKFHQDHSNSSVSLDLNSQFDRVLYIEGTCPKDVHQTGTLAIGVACANCYDSNLFTRFNLRSSTGLLYVAVTSKHWWTPARHQSPSYFRDDCCHFLVLQVVWKFIIFCMGQPFWSQVIIRGFKTYKEQWQPWATMWLFVGRTSCTSWVTWHTT